MSPGKVLILRVCYELCCRNLPNGFQIHSPYAENNGSSLKNFHFKVITTISFLEFKSMLPNLFQNGSMFPIHFFDDEPRLKTLGLFGYLLIR